MSLRNKLRAIVGLPPAPEKPPHLAPEEVAEMRGNRRAAEETDRHTTISRSHPAARAGSYPKRTSRHAGGQRPPYHSEPRNYDPNPGLYAGGLGVSGSPSDGGYCSPGSSGGDSGGGFSGGGCDAGGGGGGGGF